MQLNRGQETVIGNDGGVYSLCHQGSVVWVTANHITEVEDQIQHDIANPVEKNDYVDTVINNNLLVQQTTYDSDNFRNCGRRFCT